MTMRPSSPSQDGGVGLARRAQVDLRPRRRVRTLRQRHQRDRPVRVQLRRQLPVLDAVPRPGRDPLVVVRAAPQHRRGRQRRRPGRHRSRPAGLHRRGRAGDPARPGDRVRGPAAPARADRRPRVLDLANPRRGRAGRGPLGRLRQAFEFGLPQVCTPAQVSLVREQSPVVEEMPATHPTSPSHRGRHQLGRERRSASTTRWASAFAVEQSASRPAPPARRQREGPPGTRPPGPLAPLRASQPAPEPDPRAQPRPPRRRHLPPSLRRARRDCPISQPLPGRRQGPPRHGGRITDDELVTDIEAVLAHR